MSKLVIVESPTKAKTISKFLGKGFSVESSFGHIRDLPKREMGVDIEGGTFLPKYVVPKEKSKQVTKLKTLAKKSSEIIFATDEDREGEAISWHLAQVLDIDIKEAKRIVFHEITENAITEALENPRQIDQKLVDAQQARRILDRLVGYELSPLLWKKVARGLSAGRVQSVAVRLVVEREREIKNFVTEEYWNIIGQFKKLDAKQIFLAKLYSIKGKKLNQFDLNNQTKVEEVLHNLENVIFTIADIEKREAKRTPPPPFTTSTLQQNANQRLGYSAKYTMSLAQQLYEGVELGNGAVGLITYMRTDSLNLSDKFTAEAMAFIKQTFGDNYSIEKIRHYKNKSKNAQEAHEAIRPTDPKRTPESLKDFLNPQQLKLYSLIWKRTVATQMAHASLNKTNVLIKAGENHIFKATGQTMLFDGWLKLYPESLKEEIMPELKVAEKINCLELKPEQHFTEPPARYSDATLVKALEEFGIGRPSTYAPTIATIEGRGYVERDENKRLKPKDIAFVVNDLLTKNFPDIVDFKFTAQMEENLDGIAKGEKDWQPIIATFYSPFHENITNKTTELSKDQTTGRRELGFDPKTNEPIFARIGRFGPFVQKGEGVKGGDKPQFAALAKNQSLESITLEDALKLFTLPRVLGNNENGEEIIANVGRFGPYVKIGKSFVSIKEHDPYTITLDEALVLIKENQDKKAQKEIKTFPDSDIQVLNGRYGPYITDGKKNAKIPKDKKPEELTLTECEELIKNAPAKRKRFFKKK